MSGTLFQIEKFIHLLTEKVEISKLHFMSSGLEDTVVGTAFPGVVCFTWTYNI